MTHVHFNGPVVAEVKAKAPAGRPHQLSWPEISSLVKELQMDGFDERAIVAPRAVFPSGMMNNFLITNPRNWGVIVDLRRTAVMSSTEPYRPIKVQWVKDGSISDHWPEDLILIHSSISQYGVEMVAKEQIENG